MTTTIYPLSDTNTSEHNPTTAYNTIAYMLVASLTGYANRAYIEFSMSTIPRPYANITSLLFYWYLEYWSNPNDTIEFNGLTDYNWTASSVTWNNPISAAPSSDFTETYTSSGWKNKDINSYISWGNVENQAIGYEAKYVTEGASNYSINVTSNEASSNKPYLLLTHSGWTKQVASGWLPYDPTMAEYAPYFLGHAKELYYTENDCPICSEFTIVVVPPWNAFGGGTHTFTDIPYQTWSSTISSGSLRYRVYVNDRDTSHPYDIKVIEEYWSVGDHYVKTDGNDSNDGMSWANAFLTITKAADTVSDGTTVRIGFGTYNDETDIVPDNFSTNGIAYVPETATTGGGTGLVTINL